MRCVSTPRAALGLVVFVKHYNCRFERDKTFIGIRPDSYRPDRLRKSGAADHPNRRLRRKRAAFHASSPQGRTPA